MRSGYGECIITSLRSISIYDCVDSMMFKTAGAPLAVLVEKKNLHIILNNNRGVDRCGTRTKSYYAHQNINYSRHRVFTCFFLLLGFWTFLLQIVFFHFLTIGFLLFLVPKSQVQVQSTSVFFDTQISAILSMTATGKQNV